MKKKIALFLTGVMVFSAFTGMGTLGAAAEEELTEITWWSGELGSKVFWDEKVEEFNETIGKENGIKLVVDYSVDSTAAELAMQNGEAADIVEIGNIRQRVESGYYVSFEEAGLTDLVEKYSYANREGVNQINGQTYALGSYALGVGLAYNKEMFVEAGIVDENGEAKAPETFEELIEDARLLTNAEEQKFGLICPGKWGGWFGYELEPCVKGVTGRGSYDPTTGQYDFSGYVPVLEMLMTLKEEGLLYPGTDGLDNDPARARFAEGNVGMKFCVTWDIGVWNDQFPAEFEWGIAPLPVADKEAGYKQQLYYQYGVGIGSSNIEEEGRLEKIAKVLEWFYSDELMVQRYEGGYYIPSNPDVIAKADASKMTKEGLADFGEVIKVSGVNPSGLPVDLNGADGAGTTFLSEVWSGKKTPAEWAEEQNALYNEGIEYYKELHPDEDYSDRIIPDWTPEMR